MLYEFDVTSQSYDRKLVERRAAFAFSIAAVSLLIAAVSIAAVYPFISVLYEFDVTSQSYDRKLVERRAAFAFSIAAVSLLIAAVSIAAVYLFRSEARPVGFEFFNFAFRTKT